MNICIATIQNKIGSIIKYRILDTDKRVFHDIHSRSILSELNGLVIRNLTLTQSGIACTEGEIKDYPIIIHNENKIKNNIPVVVSIDDNNITITNLEGQIVTLPINVVLQKINNFANANVVDGQIKIKNTRENTPKVVQHKQDTANKSSESKSALEKIMESPSIALDIQGFNMLDHYKRFGVSDNVLKRPGDLFDSYNISKDNIENDPSAYDFEIVKIDDRVELRKYIGKEYTGLVKIPDGVTHICKEAFKKAKATELEMTETVVYLGDYAFESSCFKKVKLSSKITAIPLACFMNSAVEEINLENITSIDNMAFCRCKIKEAHLKSAIIQLGFESFKECANLTVFEHRKTIKKVRHHAFESCINLVYFDFESVTTIEQHAFSKTGIKRAKVNGEVNYLQSDTFTGDIEEIEILSGMYKISANSVSNTKNKPIVWTVPMSVTNIEKGAFKQHDTVICYRKSVAASSAILAESQLIYLDDLDKGSIPNAIKKAGLLDVSIEEILTDTIKSILEKDTLNTPYEIDETKLVKANIPEEILDIIGNGFRSGKYAVEEDFETENIKFKCILEHLSKVAVLEATPFSSIVIKMKDTLNVQTKNNKLEVLYKDDKSTVYRIVYVDNKFLSVNSSFIVAKTYDTLRYVCMDNKYTDIMCENSDVKDLKELFRVIRPGDTIGLNSVISGVKYPEIYHESSKEIEITKNGRKSKVKLRMNMYQALRYSSVTLKLDNNNIVLIVPGNKKIIKCASLGKTVWQNEKEDTYKSLQCTIESIEDIGNDTVFEYESTYKFGNYGTLLKRFKTMHQSQHQEYIDSYSHIYKAGQSMYKHAGDYAFRHGMKNIDDVDMRFMLIMFKTSLFEERKEEWLEGSIGKTIVEDAQHEFELSDGSTIYQYRAVKKTALRNKLMSGGDRKLYIFELLDRSGIRVGVYISLYDIITLVNMCIEINEQSKNTNKQIYVDKSSFDVVEGADVIDIAEMCRGNTLNIEKTEVKFILGVYKPNGLYYIGLRIAYGKTFKFIPTMQLGELDVALEFIEDSNKYGLSNDSMKYLYEASLGVLHHYFEDKVGTFARINFSQGKYLSLLLARELCINGISSITEYNKLGIKEILKRCLGYTDSSIDLYAKPSLIEDESNINYTDKPDIADEDFDIDESELGLSDDEFDIDETDLENM